MFRAGSFAVFTDLLTGWVLAPGRRTVTAMITLADPAGGRAHDAYHRFLRDGAWNISGLWRLLATHAVTSFASTGVVSLDCDDTLFHKRILGRFAWPPLRAQVHFRVSGHKVAGAGTFRDAVRSTGQRVVYALGLNLVVVTLRITPPWGSMPIAIPVNARLHKKNDPITTVEHAAQMLRELASWLPDRQLHPCADRQLHLCADGAYASLAGAALPRTHLTSRMRRDAALYEAAPPRTGKRGRPRLKGQRLPTPPKIAAQARPRDWRKATIDMRGRTLERLVLTRDVLWYGVNPKELARLVIVRDPNSIEPDDFFVTTDLTASGADTASRYPGRWSIEVCLRDTKQDLGGENPQSWKRQEPERAACH
ncbi:MAG: transposase [Dermatophilaceae bacterium]